MSHLISDECIACGACQTACEFDAINEGDEKYNIDPEKCTDCGACVSTCPVEAISPST
jgi:ferredoxin